MKGVLDWGIGIILWIQQFSPAWDLPFAVLTFLGDEKFFLPFVLLVYWCIDRRAGARLMVLFLLSGYLNTLVKVLVAQPRPFEYDHRVQRLSSGRGFGFPSGHTQNTTVVWGFLAMHARRAWLWGVFSVFVVLVPLSRIYLGVHFPTDILGGYILGLLALGLYLWLSPAVEAWLVRKSLPRQLGIIVAVPVLLLLLSPSWGQTVVTISGSLVGIGSGFALEQRFVGFSVDGQWWKRALRYLSGFAVLIALLIGVQTCSAGLGAEGLFRFLSYVLIGLWCGFGAPWAFMKLRLAQCKSNPSDILTHA